MYKALIELIQQGYPLIKRFSFSVIGGKSI